jgi:pimeloyl-ACP methyl ester carboxylesterase
MKKIERNLPPVIDADGMVTYHSVTSPPDNSIAVCEKVPDRIIPVIFVPGIMGSNLESSPEGTSIWTLNNKWSFGAKWILQDAKERKELLNPNQTQVSGDGKIATGTKQTKEELQRRGWGEVSHMSYGGFLVWLENALDDAASAKTGLRAELMSRVVADSVSVEPLTYDEVALSYKYSFPVHAVGYNWLQSNVQSACRLHEKVEEIMAYYRDKDKRCEYVILVTHSMGGLVARYYTMCLEKAECANVSDAQAPVLGVLHGVMPATGSATAYKRMKTGTEGFLSGAVLGKSADEMVAVFAQSPGALELLPSPDYGRKWLQINDEYQTVCFPKTRDVYGEIYTEREKWWGLCEDFRIDPFDTKKKFLERDWRRYVDLIELVEIFHQEISGKYHPNTYAFYGDDLTKKTWGNVVWRKDSIYHPDNRRKFRPDSVASGEVLVNLGDTRRALRQTAQGKTIGADYELLNASESGDGTVPIRSGRAPLGAIKVCLPYKNVDHEKAFEEEPQRLFALWSITKIAYRIRETSMGYGDK